VTETVALDAYSRAQPQRCRSCGLALDVADLPTVESHGVCSECLRCVRPRLAADPAAVPFLAGVGA